MTGMTIGQFARMGGVGVETIRYYQRRGLLREPARPTGTENGGARRYDAADLQRLAFVRATQQAGFTLDQAAALLAIDETTSRADVLSVITARMHDLDATIEDIRGTRRALKMLERRCGDKGDGPCPILSLAAAPSDA